MHLLLTRDEAAEAGDLYHLRTGSHRVYHSSPCSEEPDEDDSHLNNVFESALDLCSHELKKSQSFIRSTSVEDLPYWVSDLVEKDRKRQQTRDEYADSILSEDARQAFARFSNTDGRSVKFAWVDEVHEVPRWDKLPHDFDRNMKKQNRREAQLKLKQVWSKDNEGSLVYKLLLSGTLVGIVALEAAKPRRLTQRLTRRGLDRSRTHYSDEGYEEQEEVDEMM